MKKYYRVLIILYISQIIGYLTIALGAVINGINNDINLASAVSYIAGLLIVLISVTVIDELKYKKEKEDENNL